MSAIWGIVAPKIDDSARKAFDQMTAVMPFTESSKVNTVVTDQIALGHSTIGTIHQNGFPLRCDDGSLIVLYGFPLLERDGCKSNRLNNQEDDRSHDAGLVQYAIKDDSLPDLGGVYAFAEWRQTSKNLLLGTDRLGFGSIYYHYAEGKNILYFSSRLRGLSTIKSLSNDIDFKAIHEFFKFGHSLGNRTFYSKIKLISPGSCLEYNLSAISEREYWNIGNIQIDHSMSYQDAVESNASALKSSMARRIDRCTNLKTLLLLSGGADSRRIAGELSLKGVEFETFTTRGFAEKDSEAAIAAEVARALGVKNHFVDLPMDGFIKNYWSRANDLNDFECCLHQWLLPLAESLPSGDFVNYDGIAGDTLIEGVFRSSGFADAENFEIVNSSDTQTKASKIIDKKLKLSFLKKELTENIYAESLHDSVVDSLNKFSNTENQLTLFFLMNRTRRSIALSSGRVLKSRIETLYPFLDIDVLSASLSIPYEHRLRHTLRKDIVKFAYPELSSIPYTQYKSEVDNYSNNLKKSYRREKVFQLRNNIKKFALPKEILMRRVVIPKLLSKYLFSYFGYYQPPYELGLTFQIFYEWFAENGYQLSDFR